MIKKDAINKPPIDFDTLENPVTDLETESFSPDKWVKPEMLRRVAERDFTNIDDDSAIDE